jgi:hypothetical protein
MSEIKVDPVMAILEKEKIKDFPYFRNKGGKFAKKNEEKGSPVALVKGDKLSDALPSLQQQEEIEKLKEDFSIMKRKQIVNEGASLRHYKKLLKFMHAHKAKRNLDRIEDRLDYLAKKLKCEIGKNIVLREVSRCYPIYLPHLTKALDNSDSWWDEKDHYTIERWARFLEDEIKKEAERKIKGEL